MPDIPVITPVIPSADGPKYDEDYNFLVGDSTEVPDIGEKETEGTEENKEQETEEQEETTEESEEETEEIIEPVKIPYDRPTIKEVKEKYPNLFKDFPAIKEAMFREAEYTQLFPTVGDAKEAFTDNEAFTVLSDAALSGDSAPLIDSLEKTDKKAFESFSVSFLPNLYKKNTEVYSSVITPLFEGFFRQVYSQGDENLKNSAINLAEFIFGKDGEASCKGEKTISKSFKITEEQAKLKKDNDERTTTKFRETASFVSNEVGKLMSVLVSKDFDPNKVFTPTIRKMLVTDIIKRIDQKLNSDKAHETVMAARWKRARQNGFTEDDRSKLISTYLARAKSLIPSVREEVRLAALGKTKKAAEERGERVRKSVTPKEVTGGRVSGRSHENGKIDYSKMSDLEILNS